MMSDPKKEQEYDYMKKVRIVFELIGDGKDTTSLLKAKPVIQDIAEHVMKTDLFKFGQDKYNAFIIEFKKNVPKEDRVLGAWIDFLSKSAKAPTKVHLRGVVIFCIPVLNEMMKEYE
jgi:hypothetical protein